VFEERMEERTEKHEINKSFIETLVIGSDGISRSEEDEGDGVECKIEEVELKEKKEEN
jgi:hypothetical protein